MIASLLLSEGTHLISDISSSPYQECMDLLCHVLKISRNQLHFCLDTKQISKDEADLFFSYILRRQQHEPIAYILNQEIFWDRLFFVDQRVLIPRPETEFLIEHLFKNTQKFESILDLCCGSGILGISCDLHFKNKITIQSDLSFNALEVSSINQKRHHSKSTLIQGDLLKPFKENSLDLIVCNPPYVTEQHKQIMTKDVLAFEPHLALFSENSGLQHVYQILDSAQNILKKQGLLYMEIGIEQLELISKFIESNHMDLIHTIFDFQNIPRILIFRKTNE